MRVSLSQPEQMKLQVTASSLVLDFPKTACLTLLAPARCPVGGGGVKVELQYEPWNLPIRTMVLH
jgi:hypothetical protein